MRRAGVLFLLSMLAAPAAAEHPSDYAAQLRLEVPANAALLRVPLDADVYRATRRADLGDLRVFNAAGEALPIARLARGRSERSFTAQVALTPLPAPAQNGPGGTQVFIDQRAGDTRVRIDLDTAGIASPATRFLADTASFLRPVHAIEIPLATDTAFEGRLRVETSGDLAEWRSLTTGEAVLAVGHGDARIARTRIALAGPVERYLRIAGGNPPVDAVARAASLWQPGRHWWSWAALGLGVAVLGGMARAVWREMNRKKP
jgi:hypothetical protein